MSIFSRLPSMEKREREGAKGRDADLSRLICSLRRASRELELEEAEEEERQREREREGESEREVEKA